MALILAAVTATSAAQRAGAFSGSRGHSAIAYNSTPADTVITALNERIDRGELKLAFDPVRGYLPAVLDALSLAPRVAGARLFGDELPGAPHQQDQPARDLLRRSRGGGLGAHRGSARDRRAGSAAGDAVLYGRSDGVPAGAILAKRRMPLLSPVVGDAGRARACRLVDDAAAEHERLREWWTCGRSRADRRAMGRVVRHRRPRAAIDGQSGSDSAEDAGGRAGARARPENPSPARSI